MFGEVLTWMPAKKTDNWFSHQPPWHFLFLSHLVNTARKSSWDLRGTVRPIFLRDWHLVRPHQLTIHQSFIPVRLRKKLNSLIAVELLRFLCPPKYAMPYLDASCEQLIWSAALSFSAYLCNALFRCQLLSLSTPLKWIKQKLNSLIECSWKVPSLFPPIYANALFRCQLRSFSTHAGVRNGVLEPRGSKYCAKVWQLSRFNSFWERWVGSNLSKKHA